MVDYDDRARKILTAEQCRALDGCDESLAYLAEIIAKGEAAGMDMSAAREILDFRGKQARGLREQFAPKEV